ncbi:zinc-dependent alcohol dehydrogenase family protein [Halomonas cupida]|uniref:zinc-dependent alcohol dehydrogenase family protein n=1 Tax=Halomonas cupida TaxID=44933 RepID=UPI003A934365
MSGTFRVHESFTPGLDGIRPRARARRALAVDEVRVKVAAAAINYRDYALATGEYLPQMARPYVPLSEGAGIVLETGDQVTDLTPGDRVMGHYTSAWLDGVFQPSYHDSKIGGPLDGWLAEEIVMPASALLEVPEGWSLMEAASLAISGVTAWHALGDVADLHGRHVLIEGTGNVSLMALELAASAGARPIVVTSREQLSAQLHQLGAEVVIGPGSSSTRLTQIMQATEGRGVSVAVDVAGGETLMSLVLPAMATGGRIAVVGFLDDSHVHGDLVGPMLKGLLRLEGISVGSRAQFAELLDFMGKHQLRPRIAATLAPEEIQRALTLRPESLGKTVILVDEVLAHSVSG